MRVNIKLILFIVMFPLISSFKINTLNFWEILSSSRKEIINYLFPKNPNIVRVNNTEEARKTDKTVILNFIGLVERYGYPAEEHYVTTEDGYNLVIHRIPGSPLSKSNNQQRKEVVFLAHGIFCTSDCWVLYGPGKDLAFLLADEGYDVWLANYRGNAYSKSHVEKSPQNRSFWEFSYHEIGTQDLPIMIDYILNYTKHKALRYIGYSLGTTVLYVLLSIKPEYNAKIILGICLGPIAVWKEPPIPVIPFIDKIPKIKEFLDKNEIYELLPLSSTSITIGRTLCANEAPTQFLCTKVFFLLAGFDPAQLNTTTMPIILSYHPAGASLKTAYHLYQNIRTCKFQTYDEYFDSYERYKQETPINYDLRKVTAPLAMFYGINDFLSLKPNVLETSRQLPNVILLEENSYKFFNHIDFLWSIDAKSLLYDRVIEVMQKFDINSGSAT